MRIEGIVLKLELSGMDALVNSIPTRRAHAGINYLRVRNAIKAGDATASEGDSQEAQDYRELSGGAPLDTPQVKCWTCGEPHEGAQHDCVVTLKRTVAELRAREG